MAPYSGESMTTTTVVSEEAAKAVDDWLRKPTKAEQEAKRSACLAAAKADLAAPRNEYKFRCVVVVRSASPRLASPRPARALSHTRARVSERGSQPCVGQATDLADPPPPFSPLLATHLVRRRHLRRLPASPKAARLTTTSMSASRTPGTSRCSTC